jgi:hypothetical protein
MQDEQQLSRSQSLLTRDTIDAMMADLTQLCDGIERHGLVDYQYGVWEERIVEGLYRDPCVKSKMR